MPHLSPGRPWSSTVAKFASVKDPEYRGRPPRMRVPPERCRLARNPMKPLFGTGPIPGFTILVMMEVAVSGGPMARTLPIGLESKGGPDRDEVHRLSRWRLLEKVPREEVGIVNSRHEVPTDGPGDERIHLVSNIAVVAPV